MSAVQDDPWKAQLEALGALLRAQRMAAELSLRELSERTNVSNAYLSQIENGKIKQPSPTLLHKLAELYDVSYKTAMELAGYPTAQISGADERAASRRRVTRIPVS